MVRLIKKIIGGENSMLQLVDENDILHYEDKLPDVLNYNPIPIPISHFNLSSQEKFIKSIVQKCLRPNRIYKITHRGVLEIVDKMLQFQKSDNIKLISYDVLVLSLIIALKPISSITYQGTIEVVRRVVSPVVLEHLPITSAILTAVGIAFRANLNAGVPELSFQFFLTVLKTVGSFRAAELVRSRYFIDCTDYVKELPQANINELTRGETLPELDSSSSKSLISYTRENPTRHDTFVSTSPNQQLHYQEEVKIETLDGEIRRVKTLKGEKICYMPDRDPKTKNLANYIPLEQRTKTLADVKNLDSTLDRESAGDITNSIIEENSIIKIIKCGIF